MKRLAKILFCLASMLPLAAVGAQQQFIETPSLAEQVQSGEVPPVAQRIPQVPRRIELGGEFSPGQHGGSCAC